MCTNRPRDTGTSTGAHVGCRNHGFIFTMTHVPWANLHQNQQIRTPTCQTIARPEFPSHECKPHPAVQWKWNSGPVAKPLSALASHGPLDSRLFRAWPPRCQCHHGARSSGSPRHGRGAAATARAAPVAAFIGPAPRHVGSPVPTHAAPSRPLTSRRQAFVALPPPPPPRLAGVAATAAPSPGEAARREPRAGASAGGPAR